MAVIVWQLDLQLHIKSVPITTEGVSSNPTTGEVYPIQHYVIQFVSDMRHLCLTFSSTRERLWVMVINATFNNMSVYRGSKFYWVRKPGYPEKPAEMSHCQSQSISWLTDHHFAKVSRRCGLSTATN
jgi:hypothetical protein